MTRDVPSRRAFLAGAGTASAVAVAGCLDVLLASDPECSGEQRRVDWPVAGDPDADVVVTAYKDYSCGHCREFVLEALPPIESEYVEPGIARYEPRAFPLPVDDWSWPVANAALAVLDDAGEDAYWEFSTRAFESQGDYSADRLAALAEEAGASSDRIRTVVDEQPYCEQVAESKREGEERGVDSTPTVFVNERVLEGPTAAEVAEAIEAER